MNPVILFRSDNSAEALAERAVAEQHFPVVAIRTAVPAGSLVICRYSALPYFRELEMDVIKLRSLLVNSYREHQWIANFVDYYEELKDVTPRSWTEAEYPSSGYDGPVVIKGRTNSIKRRWRNGMYAENRLQAVVLANDLANDPLIGSQGLIYRQFVPFVTFEHDPISGLPMTNEHRFFFYKTTLLAHGYYWVTASEEAQKKATCGEDGIRFARDVADRVAPHVTFFVLDIAEKQAGGWMLVEINDAMMSGLSDCQAEVLYPALKAALAKDGHS